MDIETCDDAALLELFEDNGILRQDEQQNCSSTHDERALCMIFNEGTLARRNRGAPSDRSVMLDDIIKLRMKQAQVGKHTSAELRQVRGMTNNLELEKSWFHPVVNRCEFKFHELDYLSGGNLTNPNWWAMPEDARRRRVHFLDLGAAPGGFAASALRISRFAHRCDPCVTCVSLESGGVIMMDKNLLLDPGIYLTKNGDILSDETREECLDRALLIGGFDVCMGDVATEVDRDRQETLHLKLFCHESLLGLQCLKRGGFFLLKLFDCFTEPTQYLIYLLHKCFISTMLAKPLTSRPANSEIYLMGTWYLGTERCDEYLESIEKLAGESPQADDPSAEAPSVNAANEEFEKFKLQLDYWLYERVKQQLRNLELMSLAFEGKVTPRREADRRDRSAKWISKWGLNSHLIRPLQLHHFAFGQIPHAFTKRDLFRRV